jgi:MraZ protein
MTALGTFVGTHQKSVDAKGRVSVPPGFRAILSREGFEGHFARTHRRDAALECGTQEWVTHLGPSQEALDPDSVDYEDQLLLRVGQSEALSWDPEGRVTLPKKFLEHTGITNAAVFVGLKTHFQIWEPGAFAQRLAEARAREATRAAKGKAS